MSRVEHELRTAPERCAAPELRTTRVLRTSHGRAWALRMAAAAVCVISTLASLPSHAALLVEEKLAPNDSGLPSSRSVRSRVGAEEDETKDSEKPAEADASIDEGPPFDASPVALDPKTRVEAHAGLWLIEQAGRLRMTYPAIGIGLSGMVAERVRWDAGYLFTFGQVGTPDFNVLNTFHSLRARVHYGWQLGGAWLFAGAGPVMTIITSSNSVEGTQTDSSISLTGGGELALGLQTEVGGRLVRFELAAMSRALHGMRVDGRAGISVGF